MNDLLLMVDPLWLDDVLRPETARGFQQLSKRDGNCLQAPAGLRCCNQQIVMESEMLFATSCCSSAAAVGCGRAAL